MAIQLAGNTVIHDNQNVQVSGVTTASSFVGDGSQLTNLPASGGTLEATASGTLADGSKVIVNADGTVSVVTQTETTGAGTGSPTVFESATTYDNSATFDSTNGKVVIAYKDDANNQYGTAIVGTVSGTSISFGSPTVFNSNGNTQQISAVYDSSNQKVVISYLDRGNSTYGTAGTAIVGTVSGTGISFGSPTVFNTANTGAVSSVYDPTNQKVVVTYCDFGDNSYGKAIVGTVSGTGISFGSETTFNSGNTNQYTSAVYDSTNQKVVIAYKDNGNSLYGTVIVGTVSGTGISFGSPVVFNAGNTGTIVAGYDSTNNKVVIAFQDVPNSDRGRAIVGTVSGTSISFGTPVTFTPDYTNNFSVTFDPTVGKVVITYRDGGNSYYGTAIVGTVSGTGISFGSPTVFNTANTNRISATFDSTNNKVVIAYTDNGNSNYGTASVFSQTGFPVHQLGSEIVFESATAYTHTGTYDSTNGKVIITYTDNSNGNAGTAVVGTVSGTSITFGSESVFESGNTQEIRPVYDSTNEKVVIAYRDAGNSYYGTAVVGTVSGTSISFGSPVVFESSNSYNISATYDSTNSKVVISYTDYPNSNRGTSIVGTVSGTSISFGSAVVFNSASAGSYNISSAFDSTNSKVVIAYQDNGNSTYGTAIVGTVSGTSISFGSAVVFESAQPEYNAVVYDSTNGKVVIAYQDTGNSQYGTAIVGTVSGTSISFGSPTVFYSGRANYISAVFDSHTGKVVIAYQDNQNSLGLGKVVSGTVSGTSISFGTTVTFYSANTQEPSAIFDSSNGKVVIAYGDNPNSNRGTSVVFSPATLSRNLTAENFIGISDGSYSDGQTATIQISGSIDDAQSSLTPGQKYYVQNDGTLSETADSPSVFAGTAVASTKLIING